MNLNYFFKRASTFLATAVKRASTFLATAVKRASTFLATAVKRATTPLAAAVLTSSLMVVPLPSFSDDRPTSTLEVGKLFSKGDLHIVNISEWGVAVQLNVPESVALEQERVQESLSLLEARVSAENKDSDNTVCKGPGLFVSEGGWSEEFTKSMLADFYGSLMGLDETQAGFAYSILNNAMAGSKTPSRCFTGFEPGSKMVVPGAGKDGAPLQITPEGVVGASNTFVSGGKVTLGDGTITVQKLDD